MSHLCRDGTGKAAENGSIWWPKLLLKWHQLKPNTKIVFHSPRISFYRRPIHDKWAGIKTWKWKHKTFPNPTQTASERLKFTGAFLTMSSFFFILVDSRHLKECIERAEFSLNLELWFGEQQTQSETTPNESPGSFSDTNLMLASTRTLQLNFHPGRGIHYHLPVLFDYFHLAAVSLGIHASLIAMHQPYIKWVNDLFCSQVAVIRVDWDILRNWRAIFSKPVPRGMTRGNWMNRRPSKMARLSANLGWKKSTGKVRSERFGQSSGVSGSRSKSRASNYAQRPFPCVSDDQHPSSVSKSDLAS